jgi:putative PIN family toxin of toxin-antitoxin system
MKPVVLDTNILLDILVFNDARAADLKQAIFSGTLKPIASQKTLAELADVISRPRFKLSQATQAEILEQWHSVISLRDDSHLASAPWQCQDQDDQIFLDIAYQLRPTVLISKDNAVLEIASRAIEENILITNDYNAFKQLS